VAINPGGGLLLGDSDPDGDPIRLAADPGLQVAGLLTDPDGTFRYTPAPGFYGPVTVNYLVTDGVLSTKQTATINVVENPPVAVNDDYPVSHPYADPGLLSWRDAPPPLLTVDAAHGVLANDTDADNDHLTATLNGQASHGTVALNADGSFTYTPTQVVASNISYTDSFTYYVN